MIRMLLRLFRLKVPSWSFRGHQESFTAIASSAASYKGFVSSQVFLQSDPVKYRELDCNASRAVLQEEYHHAPPLTPISQYGRRESVPDSLGTKVVTVAV